MIIFDKGRTMIIPAKYILTPKISKFLQQIEAAKEVINSVNIPPEVEANIRRLSILKSSLFSARIEGNTLNLEDLPKEPSKSQKRLEVFNILKALNWVNSKKFRQFTIQNILVLHKMVMEGLIEKDDMDKFRTEVGAIFNEAGIAIYLPPRPSQLLGLIERLVSFINSTNEQFIPIKASLVHFTFEKIHPFLDGNGRVGRLILQAIMQKGDFGMKGLLSTEEYLDNNRDEYYMSLEKNEQDVTEYLEFMLEAVSQTANQAKEEVLKKKEVGIEDLLLPRRAEILKIINDQNLVNFDTIRRRFLSVNERTLRYDLKYLVDRNLIKKLGSTKGVYYTAVTI